MLRIQFTYLVTLPRDLGYSEEKLCGTFVESYGAALENLANLETTRSLFVTMCSSALGSEKVKKMARRTKSAMARDKRCWNEKCTSVHHSSEPSCGKMHRLKSNFKQTV